MQQKFANALGNPDKAKRDKHMRLLSGLISTQLYTELEMMKLWKALYYCLWLADKAAVQNDVSQWVCSLVHICKDEEQAQLFARCFFKTIMREWGSMDYHRVNKFYACIRIMFREVVVYLKEREWDAALVASFLADIDSIVLHKAPNGPRMHMADIFLREVYNGACKVRGVGRRTTKQTKKSATAAAGTNVESVSMDADGLKTISDKTLHQLLGPWLKIACTERDHVFRKRVLQEVFSAYASTYCRELVPADEPAKKRQKNGEPSPDDVAAEEERTLFTNNDSRALQGLLWGAAAQEGLGKLQREGLYGVHELFQKVTGVQFVDDYYESVAATPETENKGKDPTKKEVTAAASEESEESEEWSSGADDGGMEFEASSDEEGSQESELEPEPIKSVEKQNKKRKLEEASAKEKARVSEKKETKKVEKKDVPVVKENPSFIATKKFAGAKIGYVFKKDSQGLGYYLDSKGKKSAGKGSGKNTRTDAPSAKESKNAKSVRFGSDQTVSHTKSVKALQASKSPEQAKKFTPKKAALKKGKR